MIRLMAAVTLALGLGAPAAQAQGRLGTDIPAEFPPSSYTGKQYVDSRGCVYVRAGIDGNTTWVPRVTRDRKHLCGAKPTFAKAAPAPEPRPVPRTAQVVTPEPTVTPKPAPKPQTRVAQRVVAPEPAPRPKTNRKPLKTVAGAPGRVVRTPASKPVTAPPPRLVRAVPKEKAAKQARLAPVNKGGSCKGASALSQRYINQGAGVRCGPQDTPHVAVIRRGESPGPGKNVYVNKTYGWQDGRLPAKTVIVPRHVYENRLPAKRVIPKGYKPAFDDGRFNPRRAYQTVEGYRQTRLRWTNTVPRRLIDPGTGEDVTDLYPNIVYRVEGSDRVVSTRSTEARRPVVASKSRSEPARAVVSTRQAPKRPAEAAKARYVEIGLFTKDALARKTARRFQQMGVPVKYGVSRRNGQPVKRVLLGPFRSADAWNRALGQAREAGYPRAFLR
ncbi:SPOR domain-containing protein [Aestuariicoccus sp. MJ-SS9]|uniref:SPOR domain-containing protein n=1 Tax=Aestuariicoccus sp. MJ-SS9 TaxID=3079855 RepID=UPI00290F2206|nr:SPOR domain-containing protein [Aestuariicoccus sp. MJ-SS9]MDU8912794.1 SPOR domain-containing protein [Aestuariicoccus sp. MJ-SS9]